MTTLVLFACWMPDSGPNSKAWAAYYRDLLSGEFAECDKIICFNHGCHPAAEEYFGHVPHVLRFETVSEAMHINSDAAGYQLALKCARKILPDYETVLFLHTKGMSKPFSDLAGFRWYFGEKLLKKKIIVDAHQNHPYSLTAVSCHPPTVGKDIRIFRSMLRKSGPGVVMFMLNVTYTVYSCAADLLNNSLLTLGDEFLNENLSRRYDRFFFEQMLPSILITLGGDLNTLGDSKYNNLLNRSVSYNYDLAHNTAIVNHLYRDYVDAREYYQIAVPMVFGPVDEVAKITLMFGI